MFSIARKVNSVIFIMAENGVYIAVEKSSGSKCTYFDTYQLRNSLLFSQFFCGVSCFLLSYTK